jgi:hypothetical protein
MKKLIVTISSTFLLLLFIPAVTKGVSGASLYFTPSAGNVAVGQEFNVVLKVSSSDEAINAAQATVIFPRAKLEVVRVTKAGSIFALWTEEPAAAQNLGQVAFAGGLPTPGFTGSGGTIINITFRAKNAGTATVGITGAAVLANDGVGTNILTSVGGATFTIQPGVVVPPPLPPIPTVPVTPKISSLTHPDPDKWYNLNDPAFSWFTGADITGVATRLDKNSFGDPGRVSEGVFATKSFTDLEDGIQYFHVRLRNKIGWSAPGHYRIQIDTVAPRSLTLKIKEGAATSEVQPTVIIDAQDDLSGIEFFDLQVDQGPVIRLPGSPRPQSYRLAFLKPGAHKVKVSASDRARNETRGEVDLEIIPLEAPKITLFTRELHEGDLLPIAGEALPRAKVVVFIKYNGQDLGVFETHSHDDGSWQYIYPEFLRVGVYTIRVQALTPEGIETYLSDELKIQVIETILFTIGRFKITFREFMYFLLALLAIVMVIIYMLWRYLNNFKEKLRHETADVNEVMRDGFRILRGEFQKEIEILERVKVKRILTDEETAILERFKKTLDEVLEKLKKEVKDIEKMT